MEDRPDDRPGRAAPARPQGAGRLRRPTTSTRSPGSRCSPRSRSARRDRLLDVGCGGGVFLRRALETGCDAVGLDHSPEMVALARATSGAHVVEGRAEELPFADGEFTAVSCIVAFFFLDDPVLRPARDEARARARLAAGSRSSRRRPRRRARLPPRTRSPLAATSTPTPTSRRCRSLPGSASRK